MEMFRHAAALLSVSSLDLGRSHMGGLFFCLFFRIGGPLDFGESRVGSRRLTWHHGLMGLNEPSYSIGIEEEYLIVDARSGDLVAAPPPAFFNECARELGEQVANEFLQSQIEVGTRVCDTLAEAAAQMKTLRRTIGQVGANYGLAHIAASTHPTANWSSQKHTEKQRYNILAKDLRGIAERLLICGMHVHVGIEDRDLRIDIFNQLPYFLPHLLTLSTSSPFWQGRDTGLKSYRLTVFDALPRTGLPESFSSFAEYQRTLDILVQSGVIEDATKVWWDLRPSARFETLEMRITDVGTDIEDAIALAALYRCLVRMLFRLRRKNQRWRAYSRFLINENRWRAQRYGLEKGLVDFGSGEIIDFATLVDEVIELTAPDADYFGCTNEIAHLRDIVRRGTSADRQLACFHAARNAGADESEALRKVILMLVDRTVAGTAA